MLPLIVLARPNPTPTYVKFPRNLMYVSVPDMVKKTISAEAPSWGEFFDPNQSDKRRVPKGSDPIHNRS